MKFISVRDLRNQPGEVREALEEDDLVLTAHGKPYAVLTRAGEDELEELLASLRARRAHRALDRLHAAAESDATDLDDAAIEAEIAATRRARRDA